MQHWNHVQNLHWGKIPLQVPILAGGRHQGGTLRWSLALEVNHQLNSKTAIKVEAQLQSAGAQVGCAREIPRNR